MHCDVEHDWRVLCTCEDAILFLISYPTIKISYASSLGYTIREEISLRATVLHACINKVISITDVTRATFTYGTCVHTCVLIFHHQDHKICNLKAICCLILSYLRQSSIARRKQLYVTRVIDTITQFLSKCCSLVVCWLLKHCNSE